MEYNFRSSIWRNFFIAVAVIIFVIVILSARGCVTHTEQRTVDGSSMDGILRSGQRVSLQYGYYDCHPVGRNDLVAYHSTARSEPLVKVVRAIPGDAIALSGEGPTAQTLLVNGEVLKTSAGEPYVFSKTRAGMLALYIHDYHGFIPHQSYLILGNQSSGTFDSSVFGLVGIRDIVARVRP